MNSKRTYYSIDVEASGPVPGLFNLVSLGAVPVFPRGEGTFEVGESFYVELRPAFAGSDPGANKVHGLDLERLGREGLEPADALRRLVAFVEATKLPGSKAVFVGHNAPFDWMYVNWYFAWTGVANPFGYNAIDTKSLAMGVLRVPWDETNKERIVPALGLALQDEATLHRADADARHQADLLVALLKRAEIPE